jgi:hypothetical protein
MNGMAAASKSSVRGLFGVFEKNILCLDPVIPPVYSHPAKYFR